MKDGEGGRMEEMVQWKFNAVGSCVWIVEGEEGHGEEPRFVIGLFGDIQPP